LLDARAIEIDPGVASALKLAYAAWTKCSDVFGIAIRAYANREGVDAALLAEWGDFQPTLAKKCDRAASVAVPKAWRYVGEMQENAEAFKSAGPYPAVSRCGGQSSVNSSSVLRSNRSSSERGDRPSGSGHKAS
jgi:hypothetical protein